MSEKSCSNCNSATCSGTTQRVNESEEDFLARQKMMENLCEIDHKLLVMSGKGGVGKSTVAANLATSLADAGYKTGLMDVDIHGPSIPTLFNLSGQRLMQNKKGIIPIDVSENLKVMSVGFFLENEDQPLIWRGPMKMGLIQQFLRDVSWGELDYLIIDSPPGTGDEPLSVCQLIEDLEGAVIVTTPQKIASADVAKSITFCKHLGLDIVGLIENMSGFKCPGCGEITHIFNKGGGKLLAERMQIPFLGEISMDPEIANATDIGKPFISGEKGSVAMDQFREILKKIEKRD